MDKSNVRDRIISIRVNAAEHREIRLLARADRVSVGRMIRNAVREKAEALAERK